MAATSGDTVHIHYTGTLADGTTFDSSDGRDPLEFTLGEGQVIPGFEEAVTGMEEGETQTVTIDSEKAYGERRDDMVMEINRDRLPEELEPSVGDQLQLSLPDGRRIPVRVMAVADETVTIDANHPLAGRDLTFEITLEDVN